MFKKIGFKFQIIIICIIFLLGIAVAAYQITNEILIDGAFIINSGDYKFFKCENSPTSMTNILLIGEFVTEGNFTNDIEVYIMDKYSYINWKNGFQNNIIYDSGIVSAQGFTTPVNQDSFYVVIDNTFSENPKAVTFKLFRMYNKAYSNTQYLTIFIIGAVVFIGIFYGIIEFYVTKQEPEAREWVAPIITLIFLTGLGWFFNPSSITLISTLTSLIIVSLTFQNIQLVKKTVDEMKATRISQTRPHVIIDIELENHIMYLVLRNIGNGVAREVCLSFNPPMKDSHGRIISDTPLFKKVDYFPPEKKIKTMFDGGPDFFGSLPKLPRAYDVLITYNDDDEKPKKFQENIKIDLSIYENILYKFEKGMNDLIKVLEDIKYIIRR